MRSRGKAGLLAGFVLGASGSFGGAIFSYHVLGDDAGAWPLVLSSLGLVENAAADASQIVVAPQRTAASASEWIPRVEHGTILILEAESPLAAALGFKAAGGRPRVTARSVEDVHSPELRIVWEKPLDLAPFDLPPEARIFARERFTRAPLIAGMRRGSGAILWIAAPLGPRGYDRFPYIPQALEDLGFEAPFRAPRLWAFFDSAYRARIDPEYFAPRWRAAGIAALHVAAWHNWEPDPASDAYLRRLIDACHRNAISVYAWVELPHVSEKFWLEHPAWREKTALLQDAQLDWRKLINLTNRDAFQAVAAGLRSLTARFDWDGINLAELYFESLEGYQNPARFTPMNDDVRAAFRAAAGFDPAELFNPASPHSAQRDPAGLQKFLDFRAELARRQQAEWIAQIENLRKTAPRLDLVLTHVDDRFDPSMREKIGADTARTLPLLATHDFTFLIEDPATIWNLGPQRYPQIAAKYAAATPARDRLAIDINIVERYQDVYPTKQQTGIELFELVHTAAAAFPRVALYFENSIARLDWPMLSSSASTVTRIARTGEKLAVESSRGVGVPFAGAALVDGKLWPASGSGIVWLPPGAHAIEPAAAQPAFHLVDLNADLKSARAIPNGIEFAYQSSTRALARLDATPSRIEIDGEESQIEMHGSVLQLPRGQHLVAVYGPARESARK